MAKFDKTVLNTIKEVCKPGRNALVFVPARNYLVDLCAEAFEEEDALRMLNRGMFATQIVYTDFSMKVLVANQNQAELVSRIKDQLLGRRDQDVIVLDPSVMSAATKHELRCLTATFDAKLTIMVIK